MGQTVNIFWDNSNIFIGAKAAAHKQSEGYYQTSLRIQFDNLYSLARAGREVNAAYCVGSIPPALQGVWDQIPRLGAQVETYERGAGSNTEQAVDQALQTHNATAHRDQARASRPQDRHRAYPRYPHSRRELRRSGGRIACGCDRRRREVRSGS